MSFQQMHDVTRHVRVAILVVAAATCLLLWGLAGGDFALLAMVYGGMLILLWELLLRYPSARPMKERYNTTNYKRLYWLCWLAALACTAYISITLLSASKFQVPVLLFFIGLLVKALDEFVEFFASQPLNRDREEPLR